MATFFTEYFDVKVKALDDYGAFNVSIVNDLPLFIDPFLLFHSDRQEYQDLHESIINYLIFLRDKAKAGTVSDGLLRSWYCFPEVKQNWLGFSVSGNSGAGLGIDFARALHGNLHKLFPDFGAEKITESSHLEKVCLVAEGVGRDAISDFTTNLITDYLCRYTEKFAKAHIDPKKVRRVSVPRSKFNYETETWQSQYYDLPWANGDFVILSPKELLTRDENWINRDDLITGFERIPKAIPDAQLREQVSNYFQKVLAKPKDREPNAKERAEAAVKTLINFPKLVDYYIRLKEQTGDKAKDISNEHVLATEYTFVRQVNQVQDALAAETEFYKTPSSTHDEAHKRLAFLKDVIENKGGHRLFYHDGQAVQREKDIQILFRLVWYGTPSDVTAEANDGRGPVDYKISKGAKDKALVEFKLAKNTALERNLEKQVEIYKAASDARHGIKAIIYFSHQELLRVRVILKKLKMTDDPDIVLIDARSDNKPSGSKA